MKYFYKLLLPALLLPFFSYAQSNYKPGYAITVKGDTLHGFINLKEWENNPRIINFKTSVSDKASRNLATKDITYFEVINMESFRRYIGPLNVDHTNISSLATARDTAIITDSVFLKTVQKGSNVTLYTYVDDLKSHFFIADNQNGIPVELVYRIYKNDGKTVTENEYMRQLFALALKYNANNDALKLKIERSDYKTSDLEDIAREINNDPKKDNEKTTGKNKGTTFFVGIGLNVSTIKSDNAFASFTSSTPTSYLPKVSAGFTVLADPNVGRLGFRAEVAFTDNKYKGTETYTGGINTYSFNQYTLSIIPQLLYHFYNAESFKLYGDAGASLNISRYKGNNSIQNANNKISETKDVLDLSKGWTSFPLKAGAVINKKFDVSITYIPSAAFSKSLAYYVTVTTIQASFNYLF
ncbi:outer membrane beta-barrel protein [Mucilaginibacter pocheonensis]|uniref:Outer membrane protein beta-barrel domain-containing protein n=1 Tax=Mucilaginibacter pocheonensis TaxID=398050 RepID=A0ABU1THQ5_9SPHI|nr:outer membrane beta-barrel protein [Mucilaginibacter pocheonensis]MDR6944908.1 hypothetical protein [Mucilaginibacter pocheonensis]